MTGGVERRVARSGVAAPGVCAAEIAGAMRQQQGKQGLAERPGCERIVWLRRGLGP